MIHITFGVLEGVAVKRAQIGLMNPLVIKSSPSFQAASEPEARQNVTFVWYVCFMCVSACFSVCDCVCFLWVFDT